MAAVKTKLKVTTARELARKLGYTKLDEDRKVGRWVNGQNAPDFHATMRLLELSGWLKSAGLQAYGRSERHIATADEAEQALQQAEIEAPHPNETTGRQRG